MRTVLVVTVVAGALFVWLSGGAMPDPVASRFGPTGEANRFMPRGAYLGFTLLLVVALPLVVGFSSAWVSVLPPGLVKLPHREHWLAPERRAATIRSLSALAWFVALYPRFGTVS